MDSKVLFSETQATIASVVRIAGGGMVSGAWSEAMILPALPNSGITVENVDTGRVVVLSPESVGFSDFGFLEVCGVLYLELIVFALCFLGVENAKIQITGGEVPSLDGRLDDYVFAISARGMVAQMGRATQSGSAGGGDFGCITYNPDPNDDVVVEIAFENYKLTSSRAEGVRGVSCADLRHRVSFLQNGFLDAVLLTDRMCYDGMCGSWAQFASFCFVNFVVARCIAKGGAMDSGMFGTFKLVRPDLRGYVSALIAI